MSFVDHLAERGPYTGVGSRETPAKICTLMSELAHELGRRGYTLRSGGAPGADTAFAQGLKPEMKREIYLPWPGFNGVTSDLSRPRKEAFDLAAQLHPNWAALSQAARKLMARNCHQVLGANLDQPALFVVCWTQDGADGSSIRTSPKTGGTGQAIRLAASKAIPVYNLAREDVLDDVCNALDLALR